jgi:hypothetical protein
MSEEQKTTTDLIPPMRTRAEVQKAYETACNAFMRVEHADEKILAAAVRNTLAWVLGLPNTANFPDCYKLHPVTEAINRAFEE